MNKTERLEVRGQKLVSQLRALVIRMRANATDRKSDKDWAFPELQSERNACAHSMEFWALRIEETLAANEGTTSTALVDRIESMTSQDIQLIGGEMSRQELRTARALLNWVVREMRANVTEGV